MICKWRFATLACVVAAVSLVGFNSPADGQPPGLYPQVRFVDASEAYLLQGPGGTVIVFNTSKAAEGADAQGFDEAVYLQTEACVPAPANEGAWVALGPSRMAIWQHGFVLQSAAKRLEVTLVDPPVGLGKLPDLATVLRSSRTSARVETLKVIGIAIYDGWPASGTPDTAGPVVGMTPLPAPDRPESCLTAGCTAGGEGATQCSVASCNGNPSSCSVTCGGGGRWACCKCEPFNARCFCCIEE